MRLLPQQSGARAYWHEGRAKVLSLESWPLPSWHFWGHAAAGVAAAEVRAGILFSWAVLGLCRWAFFLPEALSVVASGLQERAASSHQGWLDSECWAAQDHQGGKK